MRLRLEDMQFAQKIEMVKKASMGVPKTINIDLGTAIIDQPYDIAGNVFYTFSAPGESDYVGIRVNETREPMIHYSVHCGLITPFYRLYITTPAGQTGTMQIVYGTEAPELMEILDKRSTTVAGVGGILDELRGDVLPEIWGELLAGVAQIQMLPANANRKGCWIQSDIDNTGNIYLGFDNTVTTAVGGNNWFAVLTPGMGWGVDDYRGPIHAIATLAAQRVSRGEW